MIKHISHVTRNTGLITLSLLLSVMALYPVSTSAEETEVGYGYTKAVSGTNYEHALGTVTDQNNNVYIAGEFAETVDFDPSGGADSQESAGFYDGFLTRINADGSYGWTKTIGGTGYDGISALAIDQEDNIYMMGFFSSTVDFDPGSGEDNHTPISYSDTFLTRINADGSYGWTKTIGGEDSEQLTFDLTTDMDNNVLLTGSFTGTVDFDPGVDTDEVTSVDENYDNFLTRINADGTYGYTKTIHGVVDDPAFSVSTDQNNNVFLAGSFYGTVDFDPGVDTDEIASSSEEYYDSYLTRINADGSYGWTRTTSSSTSDVGSTTINVDHNSNIYILGYFQGTVDFDPGSGTDDHASAGSADIFLTKINADGTYGWTKTQGDASSSIIPSAVATDSDGNVYMSGSFKYGSESGTGLIDFDPSTGVDNHISSAPHYANYVTKINADGTYGWTKAFGYSVAYPGSFLATDQENNVYLTGGFDDTADFDPGVGTDNKVPSGFDDIFLTKLTQTTYQQITGLPPTLAATTLSDTDATDNTIENGTSTTVRLSLSDTTPIADIETTFSSDLDWSTVTAESDPGTGKAFVHNLTAADGTAGTYTLYIPKLAGDDRVGICPGASSLAAVSDQCSGLYYLIEGEDDNLETVTIDGQDYWAVSGLTGTGGFSAAADNSDEALADTGSNQFLAVLMACGILMFSVMIRRNYGRA